MTATTIPNTVEDMFPDRPGITQAQYNYLRQGIDPSRVRQMQGQSHIEAWDVRRTLIRIFGFGGFDIEDRGVHLIAQIETPPDRPNGKTRYTVVYRADVRLVVKDPAGRPIAHFDDSATGDAINMPSIGDAHDFALKTACSQALKRCATNLGDQFGLSLYNKGGTGGVVVKSLASPAGVTHEAPKPDDAPPVVGGELDESVSDEQPHEEAPQQVPAQNGRRKPDLATAKVDPGVALKTARQAAGCADVPTLEGVKKWAVEKGLDGIDVKAAVLPEIKALGLPDAPTTLGSWLSECIQRVSEEGMSVEDQVRVLTSNPAVTGGPGAAA